MYVIIVGGGAGETLARHLIAEGNDVVIIEENKEKAAGIAERVDALIIRGDGSETQILKDAGIERADAIAVMTHDDNTNLTICQMAKKFNIKRIVARVNDVTKHDLFIGLGITAAINPVSATVSYFKNALTKGSRKSILSIADGQAEILQLKVTNDDIIGKKIRNIGLPEGVIIGIIFRNGKVIMGNPEETLMEGDILTIITRTDVIHDLLTIFKD